MNEQQLQALEEKIYRSYWKDGMIDVFAGAMIVLIGCSWVADLVPLGAAAPAVLMPFWPLLRKRITVPRAGHVEFSDERMSRMRLAYIGAVILGVMTFALGIGAYLMSTMFDRPIGPYLPFDIAALPVLLLGLLMAIGGLMVGQLRGFVYALVFLAVGTVGSILVVEPGWMILGAGSTVLITGILLLTRFILKYPVSDVVEVQ